MKLDLFLVSQQSTLEAVLLKIESNHHGFVLIENQNKEIIGLATDGDIRRELIRGANLNLSISTCMNQNFIWASYITPRELILKQLDSRIKVIPLLDENKRLVSIISKDDIPYLEEQKVYSRARAPVRISFGGGGSDLTHYFSSENGAVINTTVSLYTHATLRLRDDFKIAIHSNDLKESVEFIDFEDLISRESKFRLIQAVIKVGRPSYGFDLYLQSDFPMSSGLGGSAVVAAAVLGCLNEFRQDKWDQHEIAELAFQAERLHLNIAGGWQDQYATVFGGFNFMEFQMKQNIVHPLRIAKDTLIELEECLLLCDTGTTHDSGNVHDDQKVHMQQEDVRKKVNANVELTYQMRNHLLRGRLLEFGQCLHQAWEIKRGLGNKITNNYLDNIYLEARENGAIGGKLLGAGGGGFFLFYVLPFERNRLLDWIDRSKLIHRPFRFDSEGLQSWTVREKRNQKDFLKS